MSKGKALSKEDLQALLQRQSTKETSQLHTYAGRLTYNGKPPFAPDHVRQVAACAAIRPGKRVRFWKIGGVNLNGTRDLVLVTAVAMFRGASGWVCRAPGRPFAIIAEPGWFCTVNLPRKTSHPRSRGSVTS